MFSRIATRKFGTTIATPKRESSFSKNWVYGNATGAWPIIVITGGAVLFSSYKIYQTLCGPDYHFNKVERSTLDYVENNRDPRKAESWGNSAYHKGPEFIRDRMIKKDM